MLEKKQGKEREPPILLLLLICLNARFDKTCSVSGNTVRTCTRYLPGHGRLPLCAGAP